MTAITLNLLAEEQIALQRRARDPFKIVLAIGVALVTLAVGAGALLSLLVSRRDVAVSQLDARLKSLGEGEIAEKEVIFQYHKSLAEDIVTVNRSRVLFAAHMATVKDVVPDNVQLMNFGLAVATETAQPVPVVDNGDDTDKPKRPVRGKTTERLVLKLDGRAFGTVPALAVDDFQRLLREDPVLGPQLQDVQLRSFASTGGGPDGQAGPPSAVFVIDCFFKEQS
jgi:hypothetical protein